MIIYNNYIFFICLAVYDHELEKKTSQSLYPNLLNNKEKR